MSKLLELMKVGLWLNKAKNFHRCVNRDKILQVVSEWIPDVEREDNAVYLGVRLYNVDGCEDEIKRKTAMQYQQLIN